MIGFLFWVHISFLAVTYAQVPAVNLQSSYEAALKRSETIADQIEKVNQTEETYRQAIGSLFPTIQASGSYLVQDSPSTSSQSISPSVQPLVKISAIQPIFKGLREYAALKQAARLEEAQGKLKESAELSLYRDTAQSFYTVLSLEKDVQDYGIQLELYDKRIKEVRERVRIGRSRASEILNLEAQQAKVKADLSQIQGQLKAQREVFSFLTGLTRDVELKDTLKELDSNPVIRAAGSAGRADEAGGLGGVEVFLSRIESRPDVQAQVLKLEASENGVWVAKGEHLPTVDLSGNYYFVRQGLLKDTNWDATLSVTLPLFAGGVIQSKTRAAASQEKQSLLALSQARRQAEQEIRSQYETLIAGLTQLKELTLAKDLSEKVYQQQSREYRLGLVSNVEVLIALSSFQDAVRAYDRAKYATKLDWIKLELASGNKNL